MLKGCEQFAAAVKARKGVIEEACRTDGVHADTR